MVWSTYASEQVENEERRVYSSTPITVRAREHVSRFFSQVIHCKNYETANLISLPAVRKNYLWIVQKTARHVKSLLVSLQGKFDL